MVRTKQVNSENGAVLNRDFPRRGRSLIMTPEELRRLYPKQSESEAGSMGILEELWYGNISPCERDFKRGSTYSELLGYIVRHEEDLQKRMNDEEKEIFEKFTECQSEMYGIAEREAFVRGFTLGARIIIEVMNTEI